MLGRCVYPIAIPVARKLPKAKAQNRIHEARKNRHSKAKYFKSYYELFS